MTIAAGFLCSDGLVLAADTMHSGINKRYAAKIWTAVRGNVLIAVAGSGTSVLLSRAQEDIRRGLKASMSIRQVRDLIDGVLYQILFKHKPGPNNEPPIDLLVGVRVHGSCRLYESDSSAMLGPVRKNRTCIGWGASLGLYYADSLFRRNMTTESGEVIAAHLIRQSKRYADGCGGRTHILRVPADGPIVRLQQSTICHLEGYFANIEKAMSAILPVPDLTQEKMRRGILDLAQAIDRTQAIYRGSQLGRVTESGNWIRAAIAAGDISK